MKGEWVDKGEFLGGIPCLTHRDNMNRKIPGLAAEFEKCVFGEAGQLWQSSVDKFSVILYTRNHTEKVLRQIRHCDISHWVGVIGVPRFKTRQIRLADKYEWGGGYEKV